MGTVGLLSGFRPTCACRTPACTTCRPPPSPRTRSSPAVWRRSEARTHPQLPAGYPDPHPLTAKFSCRLQPSAAFDSTSKRFPSAGGIWCARLNTILARGDDKTGGGRTRDGSRRRKTEQTAQSKESNVSDWQLRPTTYRSISRHDVDSEKPGPGHYDAYDGDDWMLDLRKPCYSW